MTYFFQWRTLADVLPEKTSVLEVGVGSGIVTYQLRKLGHSVTTVDNNASTMPDILADITKLPFNDNAFTGVLAAEILEHMSFEVAQKALRELGRVSSKYVLISVPDRRHIMFSFKIKLPFLKERKIFLKIPKAQSTLSAKEHKWEIGYQKYSYTFVRTNLVAEELVLEKDFVSVDAPQIHFFLFRKILPAKEPE